MKVAVIGVGSSGGPMPVFGEDGPSALRISLALVESSQSHQVVQFK
jgi:hypothetical protein